jgi:hypothetical protein
MGMTPSENVQELQTQVGSLIVERNGLKGQIAGHEEELRRVRMSVLQAKKSIDQAATLICKLTGQPYNPSENYNLT